MIGIMHAIGGFLRRTDGATASEYVFIGSVVGAALFVAIVFLGDTIARAFELLAN